MTRDEYLTGGAARASAKRGTDLPHAQLNPDKVKAIRASQATHKALAKEYGVHYRTIEKVRHFETWGHV